MDDDRNNIRFDEIDMRLAASDKRLDDIKWFVGGGASVFALFVTAFTIFLGLNLSSEKASLRDTIQDAETQLGLVDVKPHITILGSNGAPFDGQQIDATFSNVNGTGNGGLYLHFETFLRNDGEGRSGTLNVKFYSPADIVFQSRSIDEAPRFAYEVMPTLDEHEEPGGGYTKSITWNLRLDGSKRPAPGRYEMLMKVYYGTLRGLVTQARFTVTIPSDAATSTK